MTYFGGMRLEDDHELCEREIATLKRANAALLAIVEAAKAARSLVDEQVEVEAAGLIPHRPHRLIREPAEYVQRHPRELLSHEADGIQRPWGK